MVPSRDQHSPKPLYNTAALRLWLLKACQSPRGGFKDKPGKPVDYYHTCYCLSGLASCQDLSGVMPCFFTLLPFKQENCSCKDASRNMCAISLKPTSGIQQLCSCSRLSG